MSSRTSLPASPSSPILQKSSEGVSFRSPVSGQREVSMPSENRTPVMNSEPSRDPLSPMMRGQPAPEVDKAQVGYENGVTQGYNMVLIGIVMIIFVFLAIYLVLYLSHLNMVTDLVNGERVLNHRKCVFWTAVLGTALVLALYAGYRSLR